MSKLGFMVRMVIALAVFVGLMGVDLLQAQQDKKQEKEKAKQEKQQAKQAAKEAKQAAQQAKKAAEAQKKANKEAAVQAENPLKLSESAELRRIAALLELANKNYAGHRARAAAEVKKAANILEQSIERHGNMAQKVQVAKNENLSKAIHGLEKQSNKVHELQAISDAQLNKAGADLVVMHAILLRQGQKHALIHVDKAIGELRIALIIR